MRFIPHTAGDVEAMLDAVGVGSVDELFTAVPEPLLRTAPLQLPAGLSERDVQRRLQALATGNPAAHRPCFIGAGAYAHFSPAVVDHVIQRAEFYSAYTPYQPEVSQGTLQAIYEFQTLIASLLGLDVANASMYDGASAAAEAVLMALRIHSGRCRVLLSRALHPHYVQVIHTYLRDAAEVDLVEVPWDDSGRTDLRRLRELAGSDTAAVVVGYPNVFGVLDDVAGASALAQAAGALTITATAESLALGAVRSPGSLGADIAVAEGQSFGIPLSYGGPGVGLFATRLSHVRLMPGRLVGETVDTSGRRAFVLTLATREQHIRREKATSNICTNHSLMALAATVYLTVLGKRGLRALAAENLRAAHAVAERLCAGGRWRRRFSGPVFNELVLQSDDLEAALRGAADAGVLPGLEMSRWFPELADCLLLCVTEVNTAAEIERLVEALS